MMQHRQRLQTLQQPRPIRVTVRLAAHCLLLAALAGCAAAPNGRIPGPAVAFGDVTGESMAVWVSSPIAGEIELTLTPRGKSAPVYTDRFSIDALPLTRVVRGLTPGTRYRVKATLALPGDVIAGYVRTAIRTAPAPTDRAPVRVAFGGDVGGQNVCRDAQLGYPVFNEVRAKRPDVFVALGDMIYADAVCEPRGRYGNEQVPGDAPAATELAHFRAHWRYALSDPALARLRESVAWIATWDDHEVINDFGPSRNASAAAPDKPLLGLGLQALLEFNPVAPRPDPRQLYGSHRWSRHLELFVLDSRQYRDPNTANDGPDKTMLGARQFAWLVDGVTASDATWKVIVSSVPIAIPTGFPAERGRDGWASGDSAGGFETEMTRLFAAFRDSGVRGLLFITADVHFATVLRYRPFDDAFEVHEFVVGPLNAGVFPNPALDLTFKPERLFYLGPENGGEIESFDEALGRFNFGLIDVAKNGRLRVSVIDATGRDRYSLTLEP